MSDEFNIDDIEPEKWAESFGGNLRDRPPFPECEIGKRGFKM